MLLWVLVLTQITAAPSMDVPPQPVLRRAHGVLARELTTACKRSFKRAQTRAMRDGSTQYRGRCHTPASLSLQYVGKAAPKPVLAPSLHTNSCRFVTWNAGGVHAVRYAEILAWLEAERASGNPVHVLCVQESKWAQDSEFSNDHWHIIHSGTGNATGGVLFFVSRQLAAAPQLKHAALIPGRVLHLRIYAQTVIDVLGVYQHAWTNTHRAYLAQTAQAAWRARNSSCFNPVPAYGQRLPSGSDPPQLDTN